MREVLRGDLCAVRRRALRGPESVLAMTARGWSWVVE